MRAILHVDIVTLGRVLLAIDGDKRKGFCDHIFDQAHAADKYRKKFGKAHARLGAGCLASACSGLPRKAEPFLSDLEYASCLRLVLDRILQRKCVR